MHCNRMKLHSQRLIIDLVSVILLAGCASGGVDGPPHDSNVEGKMLHTPETFTGKSTASIDGDGSITLLSDRGTRCDGPYHQVPDGNAAEARATASNNNGVATLTCSDGRKGSVMFTVGDDQAIGTGMLGQDIVTLTIEN